MTEHRYTVLFEPAEEGGFVATCPALPGLDMCSASAGPRYSSVSSVSA